MKPNSQNQQPQGNEVTRRHALKLVGAAGAATLVGCQLQLGDPSDDSATAGGTGDNANSLPNCVVTPELTEGPYFVDELLDRSDIRTDPSDQAVQQGLPLRLRVNVLRVDGDDCTALSGAVVDVWHCNADGNYSDVAANDTVGKMFLRGYQVTDSDGAVEFLTIYPGWYQGRTVHIHFKVRILSGDETAYEFTSQWFFDENVSQDVYSTSPYDARGLPDTSNARDNIFAEENLLTLTPDADGYLATFNIGLRLS